MTSYTLDIERATPEIKKILESLKSQSGVTIKPAKSVNAWDKAIAEGAVSLDEFGARFKQEIHNAYKQ